jgi:hypothetical protein
MKFNKGLWKNVFWIIVAMALVTVLFWMFVVGLDDYLIR